MNRRISFLIIFIIYLLAIIISVFSYSFIKMDNVIYKVIICDLIATLFVWFCGVLLKNSSVYDPYWSVAPMMMVLVFINNISFKNILLMIIIYYWGIRLTFNWIKSFKSLHYQDWRYDYYKNKFPKLWPLINLMGINLFPTIVVLSIMIPSFIYLNSGHNINIFTFVGVIVSLISITIQLIADKQMCHFKQQNPEKIINIGLWQYSRHPNYLGEIGMWWGIFLMMLSLEPHWPLFIGPLINTMMFWFISIPLMERRQLKNKPLYESYQQTTSKLLLLPKKKAG